jgi:transcriptional regulator with XRE-family HTH domain
MKIEPTLTDDAILNEIGRRLAQRRLDHGLTQAVLAEHSGVSKRTVERLEDGESVQLVNLIRVLRSLDLAHDVENLIPLPTVRPLDVVEHQGHRRKRVKPAKTEAQSSSPWSWGDEK